MASLQQNRNGLVKERRGAVRAEECRPAVRRRRRGATEAVKASNAEDKLEELGAQFPLEELLAAVRSLYEDELCPYGRLVRKRLGELAAARGETLVDGDLSRLRRTCQNCASLVVESVQGSEWWVRLPDCKSSFVDMYSLVDLYPASLWTGIREYLRSLELGKVLPGGRYSCAQRLLESDLPCLQGRSLGEVCHIVQLAMSVKKLLGYSDGVIAPYERSNSMVKDTAAELCQSSATHQIPLASWATARSCMTEALESAVRKGKKQVPISTLKRLFRSRFRIELSETALGFTKLSDLLQDEVFSDICSVQLLEQGYVLVPNQQAFSQHPLDVLKQLPQRREELALLETHAMVHNTFIQVRPVLRATSRRARSVPKDVGSRFASLDHTLMLPDDDSTDVGSGTASPTLTASPPWTPRQPSDVDAPCGFWSSEEQSLAMSHCGSSDLLVDVDALTFMAQDVWFGIHQISQSTCATSSHSLSSWSLDAAPWDDAPCAEPANLNNHHIGSWADASSPSPCGGISSFSWSSASVDQGVLVPECTKHKLCLSQFI